MTANINRVFHKVPITDHTKRMSRKKKQNRHKLIKQKFRSGENAAQCFLIVLGMDADLDRDIIIDVDFSISDLEKIKVDKSLFIKGIKCLAKKNLLSFGAAHILQQYWNGKHAEHTNLF